MDVYVEKPKCTGCNHCVDVCPVAVFEERDRKNIEEVNKDSAPDNVKWTGTPDKAVYDKWINVNDGHRHFADTPENGSGGISVAVNGSACILCQACLVECEGECIVIHDDSGNVYRSIYK